MNLDELTKEIMSLGDQDSGNRIEPDQSQSPVSSEKSEAEANAEVAVSLPQVEKTSYEACGFHINSKVDPADVVGAAMVHLQNGFTIEVVTGVDWIEDNEMEVVYDFCHFETLCRSVVRTRIPRDKPELSTISEVYPGANWHERETHDFFGINFIGHPDLSPFLLPDDADYHPLKKDFSYEYQPGG